MGLCSVMSARVLLKGFVFAWPQMLRVRVPPAVMFCNGVTGTARIRKSEPGDPKICRNGHGSSRVCPAGVRAESSAAAALRACSQGGSPLALRTMFLPPPTCVTIKIGQRSPGRPTGGLGATAQLCAPRTLCCEAFELLRFRPGPVQPSSGPKSARLAPSLQWAHQSNLGRTSTQRCSTLNPVKPTHSAPPLSPLRGWSIRAVPPRPGREALPSPRAGIR